MADKVDKLLQRFFKGDLELAIRSRKKLLAVRHDVDENIGGGRAQYKYNNAVESMLITQELDPELRVMEHQLEICIMWTQGMDETRYATLKSIYTKEMTWTKATFEYKVSISTIRDWRNELKRSVAEYAFAGQ
ncbi:hypothetical protein WOSG25_061490 [Weissella oryzae SG25]|uniref:Uncharacterized protein n=1 Tax=Weissella oryzae (strain DSM 25784 / JCM 18191 / LMG 30913 / SG25) TaxID=1329250 RepID=A0A069CU35_WEIOS|nr:DUF722 domain-containing protein [Weissella oryzae]GAK31019.1 hypothetical protein WOSG25_061490 [Weissella oryzae SG25]